MSPVDGRTYVELFRPTVETHENVANRILDIASMNMNAFEVNPDVLDNPEDLEFGIGPNKVLIRAEDANPGDRAVQSIEMGRPVSADLMRLWDATKQEAQEAAAQSDISLGQTVQNSGTTATEVAASERGQGALNDSISMDIDLGFLGPVAELVYFCALQHVNRDTPGIWWGLSDEDQQLLESSREEFRERPIAVKASGLTKAVARSRRTRGLLGAMNVIGGNEKLIAAFESEFSTAKLVRVIFEDFGVPMKDLELTEKERVKRAEARAKAEAQARFQSIFPGGAQQPGGSPGGGGVRTTSSQFGGIDPAAAGVPEGLSGEVQ